MQSIGGLYLQNQKKRSKFEDGISPKTESEDVWIFLRSLELGITLSFIKSSRAYAVKVRVLKSKVVFFAPCIQLRSPLEVNKWKYVVQAFF